VRLTTHFHVAVKLRIYLLLHKFNLLATLLLQQIFKSDVYFFTVEIVSYFNVHGSVHRKNILIYIQQDATLHRLFYLESTLHVSGRTNSHNQERKQLYLQHILFVTPLLLPAAIAAGSSNGVTNIR
jgi:hypothetical protein